jgi:hypothetical protein
MKSLRQIVEVKKIDIIPDPEVQAGKVSDYANPKSEAEANFVGKHMDVVNSPLHPAFKNEAEQRKVFNGDGISKDHSKIASYREGQDAEVYESAIALVQDALTEENLEKFNQLLEDDYQAAANFAVEVASEIGDE